MIFYLRIKKKAYKRVRILPLFMLCFALSLAPFPGVGSVYAAVDDSQQQSVTITGVITDAQGEAIIGANVTTDDGRGTITDFEGNFQLSVPVGTKLTFSFIGYVSQTVTAKQGGMKIVLTEDVQMLSEVQVVAYGAQKKVTVTGAISSIKGDELTRTPTGSVANLLGGALSGVTTIQTSGEPGANATDIFIRGKATWEKDNAKPLIQVDGVERDFYDIDPNEIESITVLKDASATAVFGVRGANGVLLITTKRGREGKAKISFSTSASVVQPTSMVKLANSYQYATFYNQMRANDGNEPVFSDEIIQKFKDHSDPIRFPDTDWVSYIMKKNTLQSQHNINISGGTERVRYFVSAGAHTQDGLFNQFDAPYNMTYQYKRFNYRSNLDIDVTKTTLLSINIGGKVDNANRPYSGQGTIAMVRSIYEATPFSSPGLVDGKMVYAATDYADLTLPFVGGTGMTYYGGGYMATSNNTLNTDLILDQKLDFITKGLNFRVKGAYNSTFNVYKDGTAGIASYTPVLQADGSLAYKKSGEDTQVSYTERTGKARDWYMEAGFNYNRSFGNHTFGGLVLYNQSKTYYPSQYSEIPRGLVGLVGRATYDWKNRYMAEFDMGYNGSENFAPDNRFGFFPAGSVGWTISEEKFWSSIKPVINYMKFRATWGLVGNDAIGGSRFMYTADPYLVNLSELNNRAAANEASRLAAFGYYFGTGSSVTNGAREYSKNNPDVTWGKAFKQNYAVDFSLLRERLRGSFDYFRENRWDILLQDGMAPGFLGFDTPYANLGEVNSWGWEVSLRWDDRIGKDFRYYIGTNLSYNQNKIIERKETPQNYEYMYQKGRRIGSRSLYQFWRFYDENTPALYEQTFGTAFPDHGVTLQPGDAVYVDLNEDGVIDTEDMTRNLGFTDDPQYMIGVNMGFSWKNLSVAMQWTGAWNVSRYLDHVFKQPFKNNAGTTQGGLLVYHLENTWTEDNPSQSAKYPRATFTNASNNYDRASTLYEVNSSYLRLKSLEVAYNFQFPLMEKMKLNSCILSLSGYNLLTFSGYLWGDPEATASASPSYPLQRSYTLSLKLGF